MNADTAIDYRFVSPASAGLLDDVDDTVFDHPVQPAHLAAYLANPANHLLVALAGGRVVGMASAITYTHPDKPLQMFINEVGVADGFARRGIATQLMQRLLTHARSLGCVEAWVATEAGNRPARALYESVGGQADDEPAIVYLYPLKG